MKRASLLVTLTVLLASVAVEAQQPRNLPRVGVLSAVSATFAAPYIDAGRKALRELGYVEGQNIAIDYRFAEGRRDQLSELAAELVRLKPDFIVVEGAGPHDPAIAAAARGRGDRAALDAGHPLGRSSGAPTDLRGIPARPYFSGGVRWRHERDVERRWSASRSWPS